MYGKIFKKVDGWEIFFRKDISHPFYHLPIPLSLCNFLTFYMTFERFYFVAVWRANIISTLTVGLYSSQFKHAFLTGSVSECRVGCFSPQTQERAPLKSPLWGLAFIMKTFITHFLVSVLTAPESHPLKDISSQTDNKPFRCDLHTERITVRLLTLFFLSSNNVHFCSFAFSIVLRIQ